MLGIFLFDRRQRLVHVVLGEGIRLDLLDDAFQLPPALAEQGRLARDFAGIFGVEDDRVFDGKPRAAVLAMLDAENAPLQRVQPFDRHGVLEPEQHGHQRADVDPAGIGAAQNRLQMVGGVEDFPGRLIGPLPLFLGHLLVSGDDVLQLVLIHVRVHPDALGGQRLVVLGAGQGRQDEELQHVERQFLLDDLQVLLDRFRRVVREAENVAREGHDADALPFEQHLPVLGDLVLALLGGQQVRRVDVFKPEEYARHTGTLRLLDEVRNLMAQRVDLNHETDV